MRPRHGISRTYATAHSVHYQQSPTALSSLEALGNAVNPRLPSTIPAPINPETLALALAPLVSLRTAAAAMSYALKGEACPPTSPVPANEFE